MHLNINYFGIFREVLNRKREKVQVKGNITVKGLKEIVFKLHPEIKKYKESLFISVNYVNPPLERFIKEGDHISIFPPVGGG